MIHRRSLRAQCTHARARAALRSRHSISGTSSLAAHHAHNSPAAIQRAVRCSARNARATWHRQQQGANAQARRTAARYERVARDLLRQYMQGFTAHMVMQCMYKRCG